MSVIFSSVLGLASKVVQLFMAAAPSAPAAHSTGAKAPAPAAAVGGVTVGNVLATLGALKAADIGAIAGDIASLLSNLGDVSNDLDIAGELAAIAAKYSLPGAVEAEVVLDVVSFVVDNMQRPSGSTDNPAFDATEKGYRGR